MTALLAEARLRLVELQDLKVDPGNRDRASEEASLRLAIELFSAALAQRDDEGGPVHACG